MNERDPNYFTLHARLDPNDISEPFYCVTATLVSPNDHVEFGESDRISEAIFFMAIRELYDLDDREIVALVSKIGPHGSTLPQVVASTATLRAKGFILQDDRGTTLEGRQI